jgi:hypothetical protein
MSRKKMSLVADTYKILHTVFLLFPSYILLSCFLYPHLEDRPTYHETWHRYAERRSNPCRM